MKKVLITGGSGFVGKNLSKVLKDKYEIFILDKNENRSKLDGVNFIKGDICDLKTLNEAFKEIDYVVHLAAIISLKECEEDPEKCKENNVEGTENVFKAAILNNVKKVIYASSAAVYGDISSKAIKEESATEPKSQYGISKLENEKTAKIFEEKIKSIGLRFFNIYGKEMNINKENPSVLMAFFKKINNNEAISIFGDGKQTRDFVNVLDVCQAVEKSIEKDFDQNKIFNVGTGKETEILSVVQKLKEIIPEMKVEFKPENPYEIKKSCADISKIQKELDYKPSHNIIEDLKNISKEYLKHE